MIGLDLGLRSTGVAWDTGSDLFVCLQHLSDRTIRPRNQTKETPLTFASWSESPHALAAARDWLTDEKLLDLFLADRASDDAYRNYCDEQIRERLGETG